MNRGDGTMSLFKGSQLCGRTAERRKSFVFAFEPSESAELAAKQKHQLSALAVVLAVGIFILGGGIYQFSKWYFGQSERDFVYFELKVVDESGHPISGAKLSHHQQQVGVTDSFGEWRRFLRVDIGNSFNLKVEKDHQGETLSVVKSFAIPVREGLDDKATEVRGRILLAPQSSQNLRQERLVSNSWRDVNQQAIEKQPAQGVPGFNGLQKPVEMANQQPDLNSGDSATVPTITYQVGNLTGWRQADRRQAAYVRTKLLKALQAKRGSFGSSAIQGDWEIKIRHLPIPNNKGFLLVDSKSKDSKYTFSFLKNYMANTDQTVDSIEGTLNQLVAGAESQSSPRSGWAEFELRSEELSSSSNVAVYAAGYPVISVQNGVVKYWGPVSGHTNITLLKDGRFWHRQRVKNEGATVLSVAPARNNQRTL